jgi:hypothetical protein
MVKFEASTTALMDVGRLRHASSSVNLLAGFWRTVQREVVEFLLACRPAVASVRIFEPMQRYPVSAE